MPFQEFERIGRSPVPPDPTKLASQSLTVFPLGHRITNKDAAKKFRDVSGIPKPSDLADAITKTRWRGYASFIQPQYVTACKAQINGKNESEANGWVEFRLPNVNATLVLSKDGQWSKLASENSIEQE